MFIADFIKELAKTNKSLENVSISCFTATAKKDVIDEIKTYFKDNLNRELKEFKSTSKRENLGYQVIESESEEDRFDKAILLNGFSVQIRYPDKTIFLSNQELETAIGISDEFRSFSCGIIGIK
jgi:superfamily II DNA helicase RecQ